MTRLVILCVDGLDPDFASENNFSMEYESRMSIPVELYSEMGSPWTPRVWPSIFSGELELYPFLKKTNWLRLKIRKFLVSHGITWRRDGLKITRKRHGYRLIHMPRIAENLVIDNYRSFLYHVPAVGSDYFYGTYPAYVELEWEQFNVLASFSRYLDHDICAVYTRIIDHKGHRYIEGNKVSEKILFEYYKQVFELVDMIKGRGTIMLISDHGTLGKHTDYAYLGCTEPVHATSVLEVRRDIERILDGRALGCLEIL